MFSLPQMGDCKAMVSFHIHKGHNVKGWAEPPFGGCCMPWGYKAVLCLSGLWMVSQIALQTGEGCAEGDKCLVKVRNASNHMRTSGGTLTQY